jgi:hypothetical protein
MVPDEAVWLQVCDWPDQANAPSVGRASTMPME